MLSDSIYDGNGLCLGIDEKFIAIHMFYNSDDKFKFSDILFQSTRLEQKINYMVFNIIQAIIYLTEQELRKRGYLNGSLEIRFMLKSLAKAVFMNSKTNFIFKNYILNFFTYAKSVEPFTNEDLIIFYNAMIEQEDKMRSQEMLLEYKESSEKQNIRPVTLQEIQQEMESVQDFARPPLQFDIKQQITFNESPQIKKSYQFNNEEKLEDKAPLNENLMESIETMSLVEVQNKLSQKSQQFIELFTRNMKVPKKHKNAKVVMTKILKVLQKGEPHYTHHYYDSFYNGIIKIVLVASS